MNPQPLSHLTLERYALCELPDAAAREVAMQLEGSAEDRAIYEAILADAAKLPPLPQLELPSPSRGASEAKPTAPNVVSLRRFLPLAATLAAAALALLAIFPRASDGPGLEPPVQTPANGVGIKGSQVVLSLVGDVSGPSPKRRIEGERLKLRITCPPGTLGEAHVALFQGENIYEPLPAATDFACGNLAPWPGAFRVTGAEPATICARWSDDLEGRWSQAGQYTACVPLPPQTE